MNLLGIVDTPILYSIVVALALFAILFYSATKKQKQVVEKFDLALKNHELLTYQVNSIITELRKTNQLLSELAGYEDHDNIQGSVPFDAEDPDEYNNSDVGYKLYVGNIDYSATESELAFHFSRFGRVEMVNIPIHRYSGRTRGFGFVSFATRAEAERALSLQGSEFKGRQIQVNFAKEREGT